MKPSLATLHSLTRVPLVRAAVGQMARGALIRLVGWPLAGIVVWNAVISPARGSAPADLGGELLIALAAYTVLAAKSIHDHRARVSAAGAVTPAGSLATLVSDLLETFGLDADDAKPAADRAYDHGTRLDGAVEPAVSPADPRRARLVGRFPAGSPMCPACKREPAQSPDPGVRLLRNEGSLVAWLPTDQGDRLAGIAADATPLSRDGALAALETGMRARVHLPLSDLETAVSCAGCGQTWPDLGTFAAAWRLASQPSRVRGVGR